LIPQLAISFFYHIDPCSALDPFCESYFVLKERKPMKKMMLFVLALCLSFTAVGTAFAETAVTEATSAEKPAAEMTAEEIYQAGLEAFGAADYGKALEYYQQAAEAGHKEAWGTIAYLYLMGLGMEQDYGKALEYYQKAADLGDVSGLFNIGFMYQNGQGVEQDYDKAMECYQKAADLGEAYGYAGIGELYRCGYGVEKDLAKAAEYFKKARDLGADSPEILQTLNELGVDVPAEVR